MQVELRSQNLKFVKVGELRAKWSAGGTHVLRYYIDLGHTKLNLHRELSAPEISILQHKVDVLLLDWDRKFSDFQSKSVILDGKQEAVNMAASAESMRGELKKLLSATLKVDDTIDWDTLKPKDSYKDVPFSVTPPRKQKSKTPPSPPEINFMDKVFGRVKNKIQKHQDAVAIFQADTDRDLAKFNAELRAWSNKSALWRENQNAQAAIFDADQVKKIVAVDELRAAWLFGKPEAIVEHSNIVLEKSTYPNCIQKNYTVEYIEKSKTLIVEYQLPLPADLPLTKSARFNAANNQFTEPTVQTHNQ